MGETDDWVTVVRLDPSKLALTVHYDPTSPRTVRTWFATLNPDVVINAGFFTEENKATGLVISDGKRAGQTYKGFGGMFSVRDGKPQLQWLARTPYATDARVTQAVQSFPMLLLNGKVVDGIPDDGSRNRRSFIGIDRAGKVLVGICQSPIWTMSDLVGYLENSPLLDINNALNLDGGASSGLWIKGLPDALQMDSLVEVPTVIAVYAR
ncbi:MAG: phosphodiester glycosidase family protein [Chloroflexi bacterium]|nr:phosphodiester glycosidase family protein [Chloroflexota bacterium]MCL5274723.1 phosphodiester glycosidase family protein [Chloroflexota bacterium]